MKAKIILVEPEYSENIGYCARAMKNFGFSELCLVKPQKDWLNGQARSRAMHAKDFLSKAEICKTLPAALKDCDVAVAFSAKKRRPSDRHAFKVGLDSFASQYQKFAGRLGLVFGSEKYGLLEKDLDCCDFLVKVPVSENYPTLNLSHAVAVVLYELARAAKTNRVVPKRVASKKLRQQLLKNFAAVVKKSKTIKQPKDVIAAFRALIGRTPLLEKEAKALMAALK